jgi:hypothetical protein
MKCILAIFIGWLIGQSFTWVYGKEKAEQIGSQAGTWCRVNILGLEPITKENHE